MEIDDEIEDDMAGFSPSDFEPEGFESKFRDKLNPRQQRFCGLYASKEFFCNGVQSYVEAYNINTSLPGKYAAARTAASNLLTQNDILGYINELIEFNGLNDVFVDKQLYIAITQNADFGSKVAAIKEFNQLKGRITKKIDIQSQGKAIKTFNVVPASQKKKP